MLVHCQKAKRYAGFSSPETALSEYEVGELGSPPCPKPNKTFWSSSLDLQFSYRASSGRGYVSPCSLLTEDSNPCFIFPTDVYIYKRLSGRVCLVAVQ